MPTNRPLLSEYDVVIIGAGASGLMCALTAGQRGRKVLVIDHANKIGKKILISGGGRCNYTNMYTSAENYLSCNPHFCKSAIARYTQWDFQSLVDKHQIPWHEKTLGQLFCNNRSQDIVDLLVDECRNVGVTIRLKTSVLKVSHTGNSYIVQTTCGNIQSTSLVVATGGLSFPTMGATGFGYQLAEQFGHSIEKRSPALVPFTLPRKWLEHFGELAGVSADVVVSCNGTSFRENILFTHKGMSGPAILQISSFWKEGEAVFINWFPNTPALQWLESVQKSRPKAEFHTVLADVLTRRLSHSLCCFGELKGLSEDGKIKLQHITPVDLARIATLLENWEILPTGTEGYKKAEVTLGGISTKDISSKTFESRLHSGLFFIGEVLDVTGHLGGFNFQWAWASGYCAGLHV